MNKKDPPWIQTISLAPPSLQDNTADADRLINALRSRLNSESIHLDLELLRQLPEILVDVGTNAEVVLGNKHWLIACAGAAGPALEGDRKSVV